MGFSGIGIWQLLIILLIVLLIFGAKRLKNVGGDLGEAIKGFKKSMSDGDKKSRSTGEIYDAKVEESTETSSVDQDKKNNS